MMEVEETLQALRKLAKADPDVAASLLATAESATPIASFCELSTTLGFPLYEMDLIDAGEQYYANMRRSTNGGGENSPLLRGEDDYYEMFLSELRGFV